MKAYKCDRCGYYYDKKPHDIDEESIYLLRKLSSFPSDMFDLCPTCYKELKEWFGIEKENKL